MDSAAGLQSLLKMQEAFHILAFLQINSYMWPDSAVVKNGSSYDFIVSGGGTAGCVVAARLAEDKKTKVLLIEAGDDPTFEANIPGMMIYLEKSFLDWNYTTENDGCTFQCHTNPVQDLFLGKMLGGSSGINFLHFSDGSYKDYDNWAKITQDDSWSWKGVLPYFLKAFKLEQTPGSNSNGSYYYGTQGVVGLLKESRTDFSDVYINAFREVGHEVLPFIDAKNTLGVTKAMYTIADGVRQNTAYTHIRPVKDFPNLHVLKNAIIKKVLFDAHKNAVGVEVVTSDKKLLKLKARKEVIISAGAVISPKLLMLSGVGPKKHLEQKGIKVICDLPVGQNFQDHVAVIVIHNMTELNARTNRRDSRAYPANVVTTYSNPDKSKDYPVSETVSYANYAPYLIQFCSVTYGLHDAICNAMFAFPNTNQMLFTMVTNLRPTSRGEVLLRSKNYTDSPIVRPGYYSDREDLKNQVKYIKDFIRITNTSSFRSAGGKLMDPKLSCCTKYKYESTRYWRCYALCVMTSRRHYAGTNAMGSVVDSRLRVFGVNKLRVVDTSIMPTITSGETFGPTVMIAEKAADMIKADNNMKTEPVVSNIPDEYL